MGPPASGSAPDMLLMGPGPTNVHPEVWAALNCDQTSHRHEWMGEALRSLCDGLVAAVAPSDGWRAVPFVASGMGVTEALIGLTDRVLLLPASGRYAGRARDVARRLNIAMERFPADEFTGVDPEELDAALEAKPQVTDVLLVHNETTTGALSDLNAVGDICRRRGVRLLVDLISSAAAEEIDLGAAGCFAACVTLNKGFEGVAGLSAVIASPDAIAHSARRARSHYFDVAAQAEGIDRSGGLRFTAPGPLVSANLAAIERLNREGVSARSLRYSRLRDELSQGLSRLGWTPLGEDRARRSSYLGLFRLPHQVAATDLRARLLDRGIEIYLDPDSIAAGRIYFATMGAITSQDVGRFLGTMADCADLRQPVAS